MTMPEERTLALLFAGDLLEKLSNPLVTPDVPDAIRKQAQHILRHYPSRSDIGYLAEQAERGAFVIGPMLDSTVAWTSDGIRNIRSDKNQQKSLLGKIADNAEPVLFIVGAVFFVTAAALIVSLTCKLG